MRIFYWKKFEVKITSFIWDYNKRRVNVEEMYSFRNSNIYFWNSEVFAIFLCMQIQLCCHKKNLLSNRIYNFHFQNYLSIIVFTKKRIKTRGVFSVISPLVIFWVTYSQLNIEELNYFQDLKKVKYAYRIYSEYSSFINSLSKMTSLISKMALALLVYKIIHDNIPKKKKNLNVLIGRIFDPCAQNIAKFHLSWIF